jgi:beta-lactam-binding protein with PASTA domain
MAFNFLRAETRRDVFLHLLIVFLTGAIMVVGFFNVYLPYTTNHGESITVPNLQGMHKDQLEEFLSDRDLDFQIDDSAYHTGAQAFVVFQQYPLPGSKVKKNRKIYVSINARNPPLVKMPMLLERNLQNAQRELENNGLLQGTTSLVADITTNTVLKQQYNGRDIKAGELIPKGSKVDLVVGDGLGTTELVVPDLTGMPLDEGITVLVGSGLQKGLILPEPTSTAEKNTIIRQKPEPGKKIRVGDIVDIWVSGTGDGSNVEE